MTDLLGSIRFIVNSYIPLEECRQTKFPKSKKKRIRNKWARRPENWTTTKLSGIVIDHANGVVLVHPSRLEAVRSILTHDRSDG